MKKLSITCIIPFYNEAGRIETVLEQLTSIATIDKIICVDDGSTDDTSEEIEHNFSQVKVVKLGKNSGKSAAVAAALPETSSTHVLLFDADLHNFSGTQVVEAIAAIDESIDMLIFAQTRDPWLLKALRFNILNSGERIIKTNVLKEMITTKKPKQYALEPVLNRWCHQKKLKVAWIPFASDNYMKLEKWDVFSAMLRSVQFFHSLFFTQSVLELIKIQKYFYPKQISPPMLTQSTSRRQN
jgi:glycosyltransferase involved in cell wall biosynthesis